MRHQGTSWTATLESGVCCSVHEGYQGLHLTSEPRSSAHIFYWGIVLDTSLHSKYTPSSSCLSFHAHKKVISVSVCWQVILNKISHDSLQLVSVAPLWHPFMQSRKRKKQNQENATLFSLFTPSIHNHQKKLKRMQPRLLPLSHPLIMTRVLWFDQL